MNDLKTIWTKTAELLQKRVNADTYDRWMAGIVPLRLEENDTVAVLGVSNDLFGDWLQDNYSDLIRETLLTASGLALKVKYETGYTPDVPPAPTATVASAVAAEEPVGVVIPVLRPAPRQRPIDRQTVRTSSTGFEFNRRFSFATFVVGSNSQFAHGACRAAAENPGMAYNPLFLYSSVGLGKSHLLQAIAQEVLDRNPDAVVEYVTTEEFSNQYVYALQHNSLPSFRNRIRNVDVLLVDDIQFLGAKTGFQEEFFHTFNALYNAHKQMVMASDRPPQEINGLEKRLVSRFEWGLTADIQPPDLETRIAIIRKKQECQEIKLSDEVINYLAARLKSNVRRLEGALTNLILHAKFEKQEVTIDVAERVLAGILNEESSSQLTVEQIQRVVAEHYDIRFADMTSKRRPASIAMPRQVAMYFSRKLTNLSYPDIGEQFGKNHATVLHAVTAVEERMASNQNFRHDLSTIERKLKA